MTQPSLNQIMNDMASGALDLPVSYMTKHDDTASQTLSELDAFIHLDDMLAVLNKEYLDEKSHYDYLAKTFGEDDAMTEVAADMMDSAWCAMQTRYLEVRATQKLMEQAQLMVLAVEKEQIELEEKKERQKDKQETERFMLLTRLMDKQNSERNKTNYADLLAVVFILFGTLKLKNNFFQFRSSFNSHHAMAA